MVILILIKGSELPSAVKENSAIHVKYINTTIQDKLRKLPRILYPIYALLRMVIEVFILLWILLFKVSKPKFYIIQVSVKLIVESSFGSFPSHLHYRKMDQTIQADNRLAQLCIYYFTG